MTAGVWRVVTTDYTQHMMLYECGLIGADGACAPGQGSVQILGRSAEPLHADVETALMKRLEELCIDAAVVERVPHEGQAQGQGQGHRALQKVTISSDNIYACAPPRLFVEDTVPERTGFLLNLRTSL